MLRYPNPLTGDPGIINSNPDDYEKKPAKLACDKAISTITFNNKTYEYSYCSEDGVIIATSYDAINEFLAVWEKLKSELNILEVNKPVNRNELGLFFNIVTKGKTKKDRQSKEALEKLKKENPEHFPQQDSLIEKKSISLVQFTDVYIGQSATPIVDATEFIDEVLDFNDEPFRICEHYFDKKILPVPALKNFIDNDFNTPDQIATKKSLKAAWIAIIISVVATVISLLATIFSIYATYNVDPSEVNLQKIQSQLESIENSINTSNEEQLDKILNALDNIPPSYDNSEIIEKLEEIANLIQQEISISTESH